MSDRQSEIEINSDLAVFETCIGDLVESNEDGAIYEQLAGIMIRFAPKAIVLANRVDEQAGTTILRAMVGIEGTLLGRVISVLGYDPRGRTFEIQPNLRTRYITDRLYRVRGGLRELVEGSIPDAIVRMVEQIVGIRTVYTLAIRRDEYAIAIIHILD